MKDMNSMDSRDMIDMNDMKDKKTKSLIQDRKKAFRSQNQESHTPVVFKKSHGSKKPRKAKDKKKDRSPRSLNSSQNDIDMKLQTLDKFWQKSGFLKVPSKL